MKAFYRLCAKHRTLSKILLSTLVCAIYFLCLWGLNIVWWCYPIITVLIFVLTSLVVDSFRHRLLNPTIKLLNEQCDPEPFWSELTQQADYPASSIMLLLHQINSSTALRCKGEFQEALRILRNIHIDQSPSILPEWKFVYYNNLADILHLTGEHREAEIWYRKMLQIYSDLPCGAKKTENFPIVQIATVESLYFREQYEQALLSLDSIHPSNKRVAVEIHLLHARCALKTGDTETAKSKLQFVLQNGNRLFCVDVARKLLAELSTHA